MTTPGGPTATAAGGDEPPFPRRLCLSFMVRVGALMVAALLPMRVYSASVRERDHLKWNFDRRLREAMSGRLDQVLSSIERPVVVLGSSHVVFGFEPAAFDRAYQAVADRRVTSVNVAFPGVHWDVMHAVGRGVVDRLGDARAEIAIVEVDPGLITQERGEPPDAGADAQLAVSAPIELVLSHMVTSPWRGGRIAAYRWFTDATVPTFLSADVSARLFAKPDWWSEAAKEDRWAANKNVWYGYARPFMSWDVARRGGPPELTPAMRAMLPRLAERAIHEGGWRGGRGGRKALHISDLGVATYVALIRDLQAASKDVVILTMPVDRTVVRPTKAGLERFDAALARMGRETGACVVHDFDSVAYLPSDFVDCDHMTPGAADRYSVDLGRRLATWDARGRPKDCQGLVASPDVERRSVD